MEKVSLAIVADSYWPSKGRAEQIIRAMVSQLPGEYSVTVLTHPHSGNKDESRLGRTVFMPAASPYYDPDGHEVVPLVPDVQGRLKMLPFTAWHLPLARRIAADSLYDSLYNYYKKAFKAKIRLNLSDARLVHCFSNGYLARCVIEVCRELNIPCIVTPAVRPGKWDCSDDQMDAFAEADVVVCLTNYVRKQLSEKWGRKVRARLVVIPPVIATPRPVNLRKPPVNKPFILFLGNKNSPMDLAMLLVAYRGLEHLAKLVIAGAGTPVQARSSDVLDIGECDEKTKRWLLCNCELLCAPSSEEAFGMIYAEAMSYGKPVIALRVPSLIEIITDEATGILVKPEDTDGLRMSLARLLLDKELRRRMGEAAYKQYLEKFSSERVIGSILQLYKEVIGGKGQEPEVKTKTRRKPRIFSE